jgi:hypothetical protein
MKKSKWVIFLVAVLLVGVALSLDGGYKDQVLGAETSKVSGFFSGLLRKITWKKYKNDEYGFSIRYPRKWILEVRNTDSSRGFKVSQFEGEAYLVMGAFMDESLKEDGGLERTVAAKEAELRRDPDYLISDFIPVFEETRSGYTAFGRTKMGGQAMMFFEKGLFDSSGKTLLMHGAALPEKFDEYDSILVEIEKSFKIQ